MAIIRGPPDSAQFPHLGRNTYGCLGKGGSERVGLRDRADALTNFRRKGRLLVPHGKDTVKWLNTPSVDIRFAPSSSLQKASIRSRLRRPSFCITVSRGGRIQRRNLTPRSRGCE